MSRVYRSIRKKRIIVCSCHRNSLGFIWWPMEWTDEKNYNACCATLSEFSCLGFFFPWNCFSLQRSLENSISWTCVTLLIVSLSFVGLKVNLQRLSRRLKLCPLTLLLKELMVFQLVIEAQGVLIKKITSGILTGLMHIGLLVGRTTGGPLEMWRSHRSNHAQSLRHGVSQWSLQSQRLQHLVLGKQQPRWSLPRPSQRPCLIPHHRAGWPVFPVQEFLLAQVLGISLAFQGSLTAGRYTPALPSER